MKMLTFSRKVRGLERIERNGAHPVADRARRYVEKMPSAISGSGGHDALFPVACVLSQMVLPCHMSRRGPSFRNTTPGASHRGASVSCGIN